MTHAFFCDDRPIPRRHHIDLTAIDAETAEFIADAMEGLAAGGRIQLLCLLAQGPRSVKQLTAETDLEQPAVVDDQCGLRVRAESSSRGRAR